MKKIILSIFTVFLLASCAMEDVSNSYSTSDTSRSITFDKDCLFRKPVIDFDVVLSETEAAHAAGIQGPGLKDGSFGSPWLANANSGDDDN